MLFVTAHRSRSGARSHPRWVTKKERPGSSGVESRARTEQIREICFESGKSVMVLLSVFRVRPCCLSALETEASLYGTILFPPRRWLNALTSIVMSFSKSPRTAVSCCLSSACTAFC